jgi:aminopeptidase
MNSHGRKNMPDGEIFTGPVESSACGHILFSFPAIYQQREVEGVRLVFEEGRCVKAEASKEQDFLLQTLAIDDGAKYLGEVAFGNNFGIQRFTKDILFDEKIGGTLHLALGASYPSTGGRNVSAIHWDMICDLREESEIRLDGEVIQRNAKWLFS